MPEDATNHPAHTMSAHPRITADPAVMMGKPLIRGTRITVELILRKLSAGHSFADLLQAYPHLTEEDVRRSHSPPIFCGTRPSSPLSKRCSF
ncbi:MAG: DUF433 domain-containing protein [Hyphomonadaceae bacterium]|nr:DUF433 domain-containing protein [Hyphomonadaceae bacterium]